MYLNTISTVLETSGPSHMHLARYETPPKRSFATPHTGCDTPLIWTYLHLLFLPTWGICCFDLRDAGLGSDKYLAQLNEFIGVAND